MSQRLFAELKSTKNPSKVEVPSGSDEIFRRSIPSMLQLPGVKEGKSSFDDETVKPQSSTMSFAVSKEGQARKQEELFSRGPGQALLRDSHSHPGKRFRQW